MEQFHHFNSPFLQWEQLPTFLLGEYLFYFLSIIGLIHALRNSRLHVLVWIAGFLAGTANDIFFMFLPVVDNFWQAQATIMITARLPLYIPCVYNCFMYFAVISAWQFISHPLVTSSLAGILGLLFYGPYDIIGAKFLWWSWHDSDAPIRARLLGVPIGSSMWILTFVSSFAFILHCTTGKNPNLSLSKSIKSLLICCLLSTPLMLVQMTLIQFIDKDMLPSVVTLVFTLILYSVVIIAGHYWYMKKKSNTKRQIPVLPKNKSHMVASAISFYLLTLVAIMAIGHPEKHVSYGIHQTFGPCDATGTDISGHVRKLFLCSEHLQHDFKVCGISPPKFGDHWYTLCGLDHSNFPLFLSILLAFMLMGSLSFSLLFLKNKNL
jgi:hypothetical protein